MPYQPSLHFDHIAEYVYDFAPLSASAFGLSVLVRDVQYTSSYYNRFM